MGEVGEVEALGLGRGAEVFVEHAAGMAAEAVGRAVVDGVVATDGEKAGEEGGVVALELGRLCKTNAAQQSEHTNVAHAGDSGERADFNQFGVGAFSGHIY